MISRECLRENLRHCEYLEVIGLAEGEATSEFSQEEFSAAVEFLNLAELWSSGPILVRGFLISLFSLFSFFLKPSPLRGDPIL